MSQNAPLIRLVTREDVESLAQLLIAQSAKYLQYFQPFPLTLDSVSAEICGARKDRYWGIWDEERMVGFFMLRGFDAGFVRPSFGVMVDEKSRGRGLAMTALCHALEWCKKQGVERVMLKVAGENSVAIKAYEKSGFLNIGVCPQTGHRMMEIDLGAGSM